MHRRCSIWDSLFSCHSVLLHESSIVNYVLPFLNNHYLPTVVRIGFTDIDYAVSESDPFATVTVAVLENSVQRPVRVNFSTEVLATDTATGQYIIVVVAW